MNPTQVIRRAGLDVLSACRVNQWPPSPPNAIGFALVLNHVRPAKRNEFDPNRQYSITPDFLDLIITQFRAEGWTFVALEDLSRVRLAGAGDTQQIAITIDNGFTDTMSHALPVFRRRQVPFTMFLVPGFCDRTAPIWWESLERIIAKKYEVGIDEEGEDLPPPLFCRTVVEKEAAFEIWAKWFLRQRDESRKNQVITALAAANQVDLAELTDELVLNWEEVAELVTDQLCTVGAHSMTHASLANLSDDRAQWELVHSADRIEQEIEIRPDIVAFPDRSDKGAGLREALLARRCGFAASFSSRPGYISRAGSRHLLPRILVDGRLHKASHYRTLLTPGLWAVRNIAARKPAAG